MAFKYINDARTNFSNKNYSEAINLLKKSLQVKETSQANEIIGMLKLTTGSEKEALNYLEKAYTLSYKSDAKLLYNLSNAYYANAEYTKAKFTFEELKKSYPDFSDSNDLEGKLNKAVKPLLN